MNYSEGKYTIEARYVSTAAIVIIAVVLYVAWMHINKK